MKSCPRHQTEFTSIEKNGHHVDVCPDCEGLWVPGPEIDSLLGKGQSLQLRSLCSVIKSDLTCPSGCGQLHEGKVGQVIIDLCQNCGGLWLDHGELQALQKRKGITPHVPVHNDGTPGPNTAGDAELVFLGLTMFF